MCSRAQNSQGLLIFFRTTLTSRRDPVIRGELQAPHMVHRAASGNPCFVYISNNVMETLLFYRGRGQPPLVT